MGVRIISVVNYERRQRRILYLLITFVVIGLVYIIYDDYQSTNIVLFPDNQSGIESMIASLKEEKFIRSLNVAQSLVVVDGEMWNERTRGEKLDFVTHLARYCAKKNKTGQWSLRVLSQQDKKVLAVIGKSGFRVE